MFPRCLSNLGDGKVTASTIPPMRSWSLPTLMGCRRFAQSRLRYLHVGGNLADAFQTPENQKRKAQTKNKVESIRQMF